MKISGKTGITGIIGYPVEHTLSPAMHNAAFESLSLDYCYIPFLVHPDNLREAVAAIRALNIQGINITVPHKEKVIKYLDNVAEEAAFIGAVNTIVNKKGRLTGHNTDGAGFMKAMSEAGITVKGKDILIVGAGGAARAVSFSLSQKAKTVSIYGRTREKLDSLMSDLKKIRNNVSPCYELSSLKRYDMVINATPLGLKKDDPLPFALENLKKSVVVCDLIYKKTRLVNEASRYGYDTLDGLGMLLWQGYFAFKLWTGRTPDISVMRDALLNAKG
ncbi:MAG: shikimate dehydrogenase [Nitrospirota bacterium]